jgi:hypothetical protein
MIRKHRRRRESRDAGRGAETQWLVSGRRPTAREHFWCVENEHPITANAGRFLDPDGAVAVRDLAILRAKR